MWRAYVDESELFQRADPGTYILAAAIIDPADSVTAQDVAALRLPGQRKLHWNKETPKRRLYITAAIAALPVEHLVIVRAGHADRARTPPAQMPPRTLTQAPGPRRDRRDP